MRQQPEVLAQIIEALFRDQGPLWRKLDWERLDQLSDTALVRELSRWVAERQSGAKSEPEGEPSQKQGTGGIVAE